jgi:hypothetical protein
VVIIAARAQIVTTLLKLVQPVQTLLHPARFICDHESSAYSCPETQHLE